LRQAQRLGCSGAHIDSSGALKPCSSATELSSLMGDKPRSAGRRVRGVNKLRRQWENLGENGIVSIDTLAGGGLVSGMSVKADITYQPRDNDPDVFTDIESARQRARQLGCIGVSRRISKTGKTVWMPCTNMSDFNRLTGSTPLGRRHQREAIRKIIRDEIRQVQKRTRKVSLHQELNSKTNQELNSKTINAEIEIKQIGEPLSARSRPNQIFQDISGALDGDGDGIVFDNNIMKRRPIIPVAVVGTNGEVSNLSPQQQASAVSMTRDSTSKPLGSMEERRATTLAKLRIGARLNLSESGDYFSSKTIGRIVTLATPISPEELMHSIAASPYSRMNADTVFSAIMRSKPNWESAKKLRRLLLSSIADPTKPSGIRNLITKFGMPVIIPTLDIPHRPLFKSGKWGLISGMYDSRGFIGINDDAISNNGIDVFKDMTDARKLSIIRHELGHAFSDMAMVGNKKLLDRRINFFADDILRESRRLRRAGRAERSFRRRYIGDLNKSIWGSRDEFNSARKISDYATFSRDEYFAETIDALFDPSTPLGKGRVDGTAIRHAAETLDITIAELLDMAGRERDIPNVINLIDSRAIIGGSKSTTLSKKDQQLLDVVSANPGLVHELPVQMIGQLSPDTLNRARLLRDDAARSFWINGSNSNKVIGSGGQKMIESIIDDIDDEYKNLQNPTAHFVMGPSGSGKSSSISSGIIDVPDKTQSMHIGIDPIKEKLNGYDDGIGSARIHAAARYAQEKALLAGINESLNIVIDDYGNTSNLLKLLPDNSYSRIGHMFYVPERELEARINEREKQTGPILGAAFARLTNKNYINNVKQQILSGLFDKLNIWDNSSSRGAKLIAGHDEIGMFKIRDGRAFNTIFGKDSDLIRKTLETSALANMKGTPKKRVSKITSINGTTNTRIRGFSKDNKLNSDVFAELNTVGIDMMGQYIADDIDMSDIDFSYANFQQVSGMGADISGSKLLASSLRNAYLPALKANGIRGKQTDLRYADMSNGNFAGADFSNSIMRGANLFSANLKGANFTGANLMMANLDNAQLSGANLQGSIVSAAQLANANIDESTTLPSGISITPQIRKGYGQTRAPILPSIIDTMNKDSVQFDGLIIDGHLAVTNGDVDGADIRNRNFISSAIMQSTFTNMNMDNSYFMMSEIDDTSISNSSMRGSDFTLSRMNNVMLSGNDLRDSVFDNVDITGPLDVSGSILRGSNFRNLQSAHFINISGSDARRVDFSGTDLSEAISDDETNLDGAIFSSQRHFPKYFSGQPTVKIDNKSGRNTFDEFNGTSLDSLYDFFAEVINERKYNLNYRGLNASEWLNRLYAVDGALIDHNQDVANWSKVNSLLNSEIEALKTFVLPDKSTVNLLEFTEFNSPARLVDFIVDRAKTNSSLFESSNPTLLWTRAMEVKSFMNDLEFRKNDLSRRGNRLRAISNTQKLIDALFVNSRYLELDDEQQELSPVEIVDEAIPAPSGLIGSKSSTKRVPQTTHNIDDLRDSLADTNSYILRSIKETLVEWVDGNSQVPLMRLPRIGPIMGALNLTNADIERIESVAYLTKDERIELARYVESMLQDFSSMVFGTSFMRDGKKVKLPKLVQTTGKQLNFDDNPVVSYINVRFDGSSQVGRLFSTGVELVDRKGKPILKFVDDLPSEPSYQLMSFARNFYGTSVDESDKVDVLSSMMDSWKAICFRIFINPEIVNQYLEQDISGKSLQDMINDGIMPDLDDFINFSDNKTGSWYKEQFLKVSESIASGLRIKSAAMKLRDSLRSSVGLRIFDNIEFNNDNLRDAIWAMNQNVSPQRIEELLKFYTDRLQYVLGDGMEEMSGDGFMHELGHMVLGLGIDRHGDYASNYATFLALGGDGPAHFALNDRNSFQSMIIPEWQLDEPVDVEARIPGNVVNRNRRERLPIIRVPLWAELPDEIWGLPPGRTGSKSSTNKPNEPFDWNDLSDDLKKRFSSFITGSDEDLIPELSSAVSGDGTGFSFIRHKFVHGIYIPTMNGRYNEQVRAKQAAANSARSNKDWDSFIFLHERPYRLDAFMEIQDELTDDEFWSLLADIWTDSENIPEMRDYWDELLASPRPGRLSMMRDDERIEYDSLPDIVTIYQGHTEERDDGWSWTTDPNIASWFADRFAKIEGSTPYVTTAKVKKDEIHAFLTRRGESEVLADPESVSVVDTVHLGDFTGGSKSSTINPPVKSLPIRDMALYVKSMPRMLKLNISPDPVAGLWPEQKALALRILRDMEIRDSINHPGIPVLSYGYIKELVEPLGISSDDIKFLKQIEYISPEQRIKLNEYVQTQRAKMDRLLDGWEYVIERNDFGKAIISFFDSNGDLIFSINDAESLQSWDLEPDWGDTDEFYDDGILPYEGQRIGLNENNLTRVFLDPYGDGSFTLLLKKFIDAYNYERFQDYPEEIIEGLPIDDSSTPIRRMISQDIDEIFTFGNAEGSEFVKETLKNSKDAIDRSYKMLEDFVRIYNQFIDKRDAVEVLDIEITNFAEEVERDQILFDALFDNMENGSVIKGIAMNIVPGLVEAFGSPHVDEVFRWLDPATTPGGWEHEVGHIMMGMGATRHGDFAANYGIWMLHNYSPGGWILSNHFNRIQERQFRHRPGTPPVSRFDKGRDDPENLAEPLNIPLWLDIPPELFGYPENPRAVDGQDRIQGSKSSTAYTDSLRSGKRITATEYVDSMPKSTKAWLYPDGTLLPVQMHIELAIPEDEELVLSNYYDSFFIDAMDSGLVRIDLGYDWGSSRRPAHSLIVDTGTRKLNAAQISAIRTILVNGDVPIMFYSIGGLDPMRNFSGDEHKYISGIDNLGRFLSSITAGLDDQVNIATSSNNYHGPLQKWRK